MSRVSEGATPHRATAVGELPQGWARAPIGSLCSLVNGRAFTPTEWQAQGVPIVRIQNLNNARALYNHFQGDLDERHRLNGGELLFAWSGTPGTSFGAHIWNGGAAALNQHIFRVDFDSSLLDKRFFRFAINERLNDLIGVAQGGVGLRHVTKSVFEQTEVLIPPRAEQTRIADQLDTLLARIQACQDRIDAVPPLLKRLRKMVLLSALSGELTAVWRAEQGIGIETWSARTIADIAEVGTGATPLRSNRNFFAKSGTPWVTSAATSHPYIDFADQYVTKAAITAHRLKIYRPGTLIIAMYGEGKTRGQVSELRIEATINQACAAITVDQRQADSAFVKLVLVAQYEQTRALAEGGAQPNLNLSKVRGIPLHIPTAPEQAEIIRRVGELFDLADSVESSVAKAARKVRKLPSLTLAKAFRGDLVPQDPNDEPAGELLVRIITALRAPATVSRPRSPLVGRPPRTPKESATMTKSRQDHDVLDQPYLASHLRRIGTPAGAEALFKVAELPVADFYKQLAWEVAQGHVKDNKTTLELGHAAG